MEISQKIIDKFYEEVAQKMEDLEGLLSKLEKDSEDTSLYHPVYRIFHEFHGSAEMFGFEYLSLMSGIAEKIVKRRKESEKVLEDSDIALLINAKDLMKKSLGKKCDDKECMNELIEKLKKIEV